MDGFESGALYLFSLFSSIHLCSLSSSPSLLLLLGATNSNSNNPLSGKILMSFVLRKFYFLEEESLVVLGYGGWLIVEMWEAECMF
jgi:hypothetical protein